MGREHQSLDELVKTNGDRELLVAFFTSANKYKSTKEAGDQIMSDWLRTYSDFAKEHGAIVAVYPHVNNYCETVEHSIRLAELVDRKNMSWDRLIQPLGEGTFDAFKLVKLLKDNGYEGNFGLQCFGITQDCEVALTKSMNTWKDYQKRLANHRFNH